MMQIWLTIIPLAAMTDMAYPDIFIDTIVTRCRAELVSGSAPYNPMKSAYLVAQGYGNFWKTGWMTIIHVLMFRIRQEK